MCSPGHGGRVGTPRALPERRGGAAAGRRNTQNASRYEHEPALLARTHCASPPSPPPATGSAFVNPLFVDQISRYTESRGRPLVSYTAEAARASFSQISPPNTPPPTNIARDARRPIFGCGYGGAEPAPCARAPVLACARALGPRDSSPRSLLVPVPQSSCLCPRPPCRCCCCVSSSRTWRTTA